VWGFNKNNEAFWRPFQRNRGFNENIFREVEAFLNKYEDFIRITRLFEDISREMDVFV
jgi:hypothetical protein